MRSLLDLKPDSGKHSDTVSDPVTAAGTSVDSGPITSDTARKRESVHADMPISEPVNVPNESVAEAAPVETDVPGDAGDFELVLGRRQVASCLFVGTILVAIFTGGAYFIGKMSTPSCVAAASEVPATAPVTTSTQAPGPLPAATPRHLVAPPSTGAIVPATAGTTTTSPFKADASAAAAPLPEAAVLIAGEPALFANPQAGGLYLQMGAVDKGMAMVIAEGLRRNGFKAFVAPGPSEKIFRVLIGPFANQDDYKRTKNEVDAIGMSSLTRQFQK